MPIRVSCPSTLWKRLLNISFLAGLVWGCRAAHPLEQWERIWTLPNSGLVGIAAGKGPSGESTLVVAEGTGKLITWPQDEPTNRSTLTTTNRFRDITYGNGRFVAVGLDGPIVTSANGYDWESAAVSADGLTDVYFGNGIFLARRMAGLMRSTNGVDWTVEPRPAPASPHASFHFARNYFVLSWMGTNFLSTDGLNWIAASSGTTNNLYTIGYGRGTFVAVAIGNELLTSHDAITWERQGKLLNISRPSNVAVGSGYLVMVGGGGRAYSKDGRSWTVVTKRESESSVVYANGRFIACGYEQVQQSGEVVEVGISSSRSLVVNGVPNKRYQIEAANVLRGADIEWDVRHVFTLGDAEYEWQDSAAVEAGVMFYRVGEYPGGE